MQAAAEPQAFGEPIPMLQIQTGTSLFRFGTKCKNITERCKRFFAISDYGFRNADSGGPFVQRQRFRNATFMEHLSSRST